MEQVHFAAQLAVVAFGGFFQHMQVCFEPFLIAKGAAIDPLQHGAVTVAAPIGASDGHQFEPISRDLACVLQMRATAQVLPVAVPIHAQRLIPGDAFNQLDLIRLAAILVVLDCDITFPNLGADLIALVDDLFHLLFDGAEVFGCEWLFAVKVVVPAVFDNRADSDLGLWPNLLHRTCHDMG